MFPKCFFFQIRELKVFPNKFYKEFEVLLINWLHVFHAIWEVYGPSPEEAMEQQKTQFSGYSDINGNICDVTAFNNIFGYFLGFLRRLGPESLSSVLCHSKITSHKKSRKFEKEMMIDQTNHKILLVEIWTFLSESKYTQIHIRVCASTSDCLQRSRRVTHNWWKSKANRYNEY